MNIILKDFGGRIADDIKPSDIDAWLSGRKCAPATKNRHKNVFGRTFKNALAQENQPLHFATSEFLLEWPLHFSAN
jgi:hypothetical protein